MQSALLVLALSAAICHLGGCAAAWLSAPDQSITLITAITVALATALPKAMAPLAATGEGLAQVLMQVRQGRAVTDAERQGRRRRDQQPGDNTHVLVQRSRFSHQGEDGGGGSSRTLPASHGVVVFSVVFAAAGTQAQLSGIGCPDCGVSIPEHTGSTSPTVLPGPWYVYLWSGWVHMAQETRKIRRGRLEHRPTSGHECQTWFLRCAVGWSLLPCGFGQTPKSTPPHPLILRHWCENPWPPVMARSCPRVS